MSLHLKPIPAAGLSQITPPLSRPELAAAVEKTFSNMIAIVAEAHGGEAACNIVTGAFLDVFSEWALATGKPFAARFALEVEINAAFARASRSQGGVA